MRAKVPMQKVALAGSTPRTMKCRMPSTSSQDSHSSATDVKKFNSCMGCVLSSSNREEGGRYHRCPDASHITSHTSSQRSWQVRHALEPESAFSTCQTSQTVTRSASCPLRERHTPLRVDNPPVNIQHSSKQHATNH